jgi:iron(III) transport system substrate-binding protein
VVVLAAALTWFLWPESEKDVVLYCGVDQDQSRPMVDRFAEDSGLTVAFHGESEAFRSVGLPKRLLREKPSPKADVYWSNEIMHMVDLSLNDVLDPLPDGVAATFPEQWRDPDGRFIQFGARARVLLVNLRLLPDPADHPKRVEDLLDPKWKDRGLFGCMAAPLTGTTYTHAVAWLTSDEQGAKVFFDAAAKLASDGNLKVVASNGRAMRAVSETGGKVAFCLTDTDDAYSAMQNAESAPDKHDPVLVIYPDQGEGQPGVVLIPNTAALVRGGPHPENAEALLRWLASKETELALANGPSAQIPVRPDVGPLPAHVKVPGKDFRATRIDWNAVGRNAGRWHEWLTGLFRPAR